MHVPFPLQCSDVMAKLRDKNNIAKGSGETKGRKIVQSVSRFLSEIVWSGAISTQSSSAHVEERDQELWGTLEQDCLWLVSAKNNKSVSDWSIQVCTRAVERAACLACERVFP